MKGKGLLAKRNDYFIKLKNIFSSFIANEWLVGLSFASVYLFYMLSSVQNYGISWDEPLHWNAAENYMKFFSSGDMSVWAENHENPCFVKILSGFSWLLFHVNLGIMDAITAHRVPLLILGAIAVFVIYVFTAKAFGNFAAIVAVLSLIFFPRFFAHVHFNPKDTPFAAIYILCMWSFWKYNTIRKTNTNNNKWKWLIIAGIFFGIGLGIRVTALFIPFILFSWYLIVNRDEINIRHILDKSNVKFLFPLVIYTLIGALIWFLLMPSLWTNPVSHFLEFMNYSGTVGLFQRSQLYFGELYGSTNPNIPWHYPFVFLSIVTPLSILLFAISAIFFIVKDVKKPKNEAFILILLWLTVVLFKETLPMALQANAMRHFMPAVPATCILAGIGANEFYKRLSVDIPSKLKKYVNWDISKLTKIALVVFIIGVISVPGFVAIYSMQPYEEVYYSSLVGGVSGASDDFGDIYFGTVYREGIIWLNGHAQNNSVIGVSLLVLPGEAYGKYAEPAKTGVTNVYYARPDLTFSRLDYGGNYDYVMFQAYEEHYSDRELYYLEKYEPVYTIRMDTVPLLYIFKTSNTTILGEDAGGIYKSGYGYVNHKLLSSFAFILEAFFVFAFICASLYYIMSFFVKNRKNILDFFVTKRKLILKLSVLVFIVFIILQIFGSVYNIKNEDFCFVIVNERTGELEHGAIIKPGAITSLSVFDTSKISFPLENDSIKNSFKNTNLSSGAENLSYILNELNIHHDRVIAVNLETVEKFVDISNPYAIRQSKETETALTGPILLNGKLHINSTTVRSILTANNSQELDAILSTTQGNENMAIRNITLNERKTLITGVIFFMTFKKIVEEQKTEQLVNLSLTAYDNQDIVIYEDLWFAKLFKQIAMRNEFVKGLITKIIVKGSNRIPKMTAWHYC